MRVEKVFYIIRQAHQLVRVGTLVFHILEAETGNAVGALVRAEYALKP